MKAVRIGLVFLAVILALISCANPQVSTPSTPPGSVKGQALLVGKADNSGIIISAELTDGIRSLSVQRALSGKSIGEKAIAASTTTGASGSYTLSGLSPGTYVITASSKDSLEKAVTASVAVVAAQTTQVVTLCLTIPGQISGKAILSDAAAHANGYLGIVVFIAGTSFSAMTAADGSYLLSGIPPGKNYTLVASKVGYDSAITTANVVLLQTTTMATMSLAKTVTATATGSISGTALLSDGPPHSGIFVYLSGTAYMTTNADSGAFSFVAVAPGTYSLKASKEGYEGAATSVTVTAGSNSNISSPLSLTLIPKEAAAPTFSPSTGTFNTDQLVTIYDATQGASIYYTTDGTTPTTSSTVYGAPIPVAGNGTVVTIKAIAAKSGMTTSAIGQSTISIVYGYGAATAPTFSPEGGVYATDQSVSLSCPTAGAIIYYTTDGTDPTTASTAYSGAITATVNPTTTIRAIAIAPLFGQSAVRTAKYKNTYAIGDTGPAGGIVFYDKASLTGGWRYLEAAPRDQSAGIQWWNGSIISISTGTSIGIGKYNTDSIVAAQGAGIYAASLCKNLSIGGYSDWFLPSKDELNLMYTNLKQAGLGGLGGGWFWTSSQYYDSDNKVYACYQQFANGYQIYNSMSFSYSVRACRAF